MWTFLCLIFVVPFTQGRSISEDVSAPEEFIFGGKNVSIKEFPHMAVYYTYGYSFCSGAIISQKYILTLAGCLSSFPEDIKRSVRVGSDNRIEGGLLVDMKKFYIHPKFGSSTIGNIYDIGIIELAQPLSFSDTVKPISLPNSEPPDGASVQECGFGLTSPDDTTLNYLNAATMPFMNKESCETIAPGIPETTVCAGGDGVGSYIGDFGAPLSYQNTLVGLADAFYFSQDGTYPYPAVFTSVVHPEVRKYIKEITGL